MPDPIALTYYQLEQQREGFDRVDWREHPELHAVYTTTELARAAGDVVLERVAAGYRARLADYQPMREPDAVKRAWDSEKKAACFTETRMTEARITWEPPAVEWRRFEWAGTLYMGLESRHRWREVEMRTEVAKNGVTTITHALGKALPWTKWSRLREGGLYVPMQVQLVVRAVTLSLVADREDLAAWVGGSDG